MTLSDRTIALRVEMKTLGIEPFDIAQLQPASYDVRLGNKVLVCKPGDGRQWFDANGHPVKPVLPAMDLRNLPDVGEYMCEIDASRGFILYPGHFALGSTLERVRIPRDIRASVEGKSSLARLGIAPHVAAGFIDPGFEGRITLEFVNHGPWPIVFRPGDKVAQIAFMLMDLPVGRAYGDPELGSHYQGQTDVQGSRYGA